MRLHCNVCGMVVSSIVPDNTILRGWIECPECIKKDMTEERIEELEKELERLSEVVCEEDREIILSILNSQGKE